MWHYNNRFCKMKIIWKGSSYRLIINDEYCGSYFSAEAAADDVYTFSTGCSDWDLLCKKCNPPTDLSDWQCSR